MLLFYGRFAETDAITGMIPPKKYPDTVFDGTLQRPFRICGISS